MVAFSLAAPFCVYFLWLARRRLGPGALRPIWIGSVLLVTFAGFIWNYFHVASSAGASVHAVLIAIFLAPAFGLASRSVRHRSARRPHLRPGAIDLLAGVGAWFLGLLAPLVVLVTLWLV